MNKRNSASSMLLPLLGVFTLIGVAPVIFQFPGRVDFRFGANGAALTVDGTPRTNQHVNDN